MSSREYLDLADELVGGAREGDWRSAASRAYYAAFHVARGLFRQAGFHPPRDGSAHKYLSVRLSNAGQQDVIDAGDRLSDMRKLRARADYDFDRPFDWARGAHQVNEAIVVIQLLDALTSSPAVLARVVAAIRDYERDVLQDITWQPPPP